MLPVANGKSIDERHFIRTACRLINRALTKALRRHWSIQPGAVIAMQLKHDCIGRYDFKGRAP